MFLLQRPYRSGLWPHLHGSSALSIILTHFTHLLPAPATGLVTFYDASSEPLAHANEAQLLLSGLVNGFGVDGSSTSSEVTFSPRDDSPSEDEESSDVDEEEQEDVDHDEDAASELTAPSEYHLFTDAGLRLKLVEGRLASASGQLGVVAWACRRAGAGKEINHDEKKSGYQKLPVVMQAQTSTLVPWLAQRVVSAHPTTVNEAAARSLLATAAEAEAAFRGLQALEEHAAAAQHLGDESGGASQRPQRASLVPAVPAEVFVYTDSLFLVRAWQRYNRGREHAFPSAPSGGEVDDEDASIWEDAGAWEKNLPAVTFSVLRASGALAALESRVKALVAVLPAAIMKDRQPVPAKVHVLHVRSSSKWTRGGPSGSAAAGEGGMPVLQGPFMFGNQVADQLASAVIMKEFGGQGGGAATPSRAAVALDFLDFLDLSNVVGAGRKKRQPVAGGGVRPRVLQVVESSARTRMDASPIFGSGVARYGCGARGKTAPWANAFWLKQQSPKRKSGGTKATGFATFEDCGGVVLDFSLQAKQLFARISAPSAGAAEDKNPVVSAAVEHSATQMPLLRAVWMEHRKQAEKVAAEAAVAAAAARLADMNLLEGAQQEAESESEAATDDDGDAVERAVASMDEDVSDEGGGSEPSEEDETPAGAVPPPTREHRIQDRLRRLLQSAGTVLTPSLRFIFAGRDSWATALTGADDDASRSTLAQTAVPKVLNLLTTAPLPVKAFAAALANYEKKVAAKVAQELPDGKEDLVVAVGKLVARFRLAQQLLRATEELAKALENFVLGFSRVKNKGAYHNLLKQLARCFARKRGLLKHFAPSSDVLRTAPLLRAIPISPSNHDGTRTSSTGQSSKFLQPKTMSKKEITQLKELERSVLDPLLADLHASTEEEHRRSGLAAAVRQNMASKLEAAVLAVGLNLGSVAQALRRQGVGFVADAKGARRAQLVAGARGVARELRLSAVPKIQILQARLFELLEAVVDRYILGRETTRPEEADSVGLGEHDLLAPARELEKQLAALSAETPSTGGVADESTADQTRRHAWNFVGLARGTQLAARFLATDVKRHLKLRDDHCPPVAPQSPPFERDVAMKVIEARKQGTDEAEAELSRQKLKQLLELLKKFDTAQQAATQLRGDDPVENVWHRYEKLARHLEPRTLMRSRPAIDETPSTPWLLASLLQLPEAIPRQKQAGGPGASGHREAVASLSFSFPALDFELPAEPGGRERTLEARELSYLQSLREETSLHPIRTLGLFYLKNPFRNQDLEHRNRLAGRLAELVRHFLRNNYNSFVTDQRLRDLMACYLKDYSGLDEEKTAALRKGEDGVRAVVDSRLELAAALATRQKYTFQLDRVAPSLLHQYGVTDEAHSWYLGNAEKWVQEYFAAGLQQEREADSDSDSDAPVLSGIHAERSYDSPYLTQTPRLFGVQRLEVLKLNHEAGRVDSETPVRWSVEDEWDFAKQQVTHFLERLGLSRANAFAAETERALLEETGSVSARLRHAPGRVSGSAPNTQTPDILRRAEDVIDIDHDDTSTTPRRRNDYASYVRAERELFQKMRKLFVAGGRNSNQLVRNAAESRLIGPVATLKLAYSGAAPWPRQQLEEFSKYATRIALPPKWGGIPESDKADAIANLASRVCWDAAERFSADPNAAKRSFVLEARSGELLFAERFAGNGRGENGRRPIKIRSIGFNAVTDLKFTLEALLSYTDKRSQNVDPVLLVAKERQGGATTPSQRAEDVLVLGVTTFFPNDQPARSEEHWRYVTVAVEEKENGLSLGEKVRNEVAKSLTGPGKEAEGGGRSLDKVLERWTSKAGLQSEWYPQFWTDVEKRHNAAMRILLNPFYAGKLRIVRNKDTLTQLSQEQKYWW